MSITKFGTITEDSEGQLNCDGFHFMCDFNKPAAVEVLTYAIERLQLELDAEIARLAGEQ